MKNKKGLLMIGMFLGILTMSVPVSAATPDVVPKELKVQEKETEQPAEQSNTKNSEPITPDGNLTLVDDFSGEETEAKQFITLVTKDGNYFYLVIDRDDEGKETVHFLNQVDEADLLALMEDEEVESLGLKEETPIEEVILEEPEEVMVEEPVEETKNPKIPIGAIISGMIAVVGCLIMAAVKLKEMRKADQKEKEESEDEEEYYEFMDLEQEMNGEGLDEEESI